MNFQLILRSKPHNAHYLDRYIKLITHFEKSNKNLSKNVYVESHHICPKASDLFPEYSSFRKNPWNKIKLTARQHFICHMILWKAYGGSQIHAFWRMNFKWSANKKEHYTRISSKVFESLRRDKSRKQSILMSTISNDPIFKEQNRQRTIKRNAERKEEQSKVMKDNWESGNIRQGQRKWMEDNKELHKENSRKACKKRWENATDDDRLKQAKLIEQNRKKSEMTCPHCGFVGPNIYGNMKRHINSCSRTAINLELFFD